MADDTRSGRCQCGAVTYQAEGAKNEVTACHCGVCRRMSAGPYLAVDVKNIVYAAGAPVKRYQSSDWAYRTFCAECGTLLAWHAVDDSFIELNAFTLDEAPEKGLTTEIFIDSKPQHYTFADETQKLTGAEVFAMAQGG